MGHGLNSAEESERADSCCIPSSWRLSRLSPEFYPLRKIFKDLDKDGVLWTFIQDLVLFTTTRVTKFSSLESTRDGDKFQFMKKRSRDLVRLLSSTTKCLFYDFNLCCLN